MRLSENTLIAIMGFAVVCASFCASVIFFSLSTEAKVLCVMMLSSVACISIIVPEIIKNNREREMFRELMMFGVE